MHFDNNYVVKSTVFIFLQIIPHTYLLICRFCSQMPWGVCNCACWTRPAALATKLSSYASFEGNNVTNCLLYAVLSQDSIKVMSHSYNGLYVEIKKNLRLLSALLCFLQWNFS